MADLLECTKCMAMLGREVLNTSEMTHCPSCGAEIRADIFPALFRETAGGDPSEILLTDDEASCFYHPGKKAVIPCDACGRFLCALCDVDFNDRHLCPTCLETGKRKHTIKNLEISRKLYDNMALLLAVFPAIFLWPTIITAPMVIFIVIRYWEAPGSIIPRTRIRFILAFIIASVQIIVWLMVFYSWAL